MVINLRLPSVPPQGEILNRSNILNLAEQLVLFPRHHGAGVVCLSDGDAVWSFVEDEVELLLALFWSCEKHPIADGLLYPINETVHLPLDRLLLLCV